MIISNIFPYLTVFLLISGCSDSTDVISPIDTMNQYDVLATIVDSLYRDAIGSPIYLQDTTTPGTEDIDNTLNHVRKHIPEMGYDVEFDFKTKNHVREFIKNPELISNNCVPLKKFDGRYPVLEVGRVGFSKTNSQALAYVGFVQAPLVGRGHYILLTHSHNK